MEGETTMNHQWQDLLTLLRTGPCSPLKAWVEMGIYRAADPVEKLRKRGYVIQTVRKPFTSTSGRKVHFAEYHLVAEPKTRKIA